MVLAKLDVLLGRYAVYICSSFFALSIVLGVGWYVSNTKLEAQRAKAENAEMRLTVSNTSIASLKNELAEVNATLERTHAEAVAQRESLAQQLRIIDKNDEQKVMLEKYLKSRPSTSNCPIPKDLMDAWNSL